MTMVITNGYTCLCFGCTLYMLVLFVPIWDGDYFVLLLLPLRVSCHLHNFTKEETGQSNGYLHVTFSSDKSD
jgi:hypothetical protein